MKIDLQKTQQIMLIIVLGLLALSMVLLLTTSAYGAFADRAPSCNVADLKLYGGLVYYPNEGLSSGGTADQTAAESIRHQIEAADADPGIKAILLQIDSPGGDPVAGEDVASALRHATKPTVALVADEGDSAAYWAATGAQTIFASANSSLADIGVTESYLDQTKQDAANGLTFVSLTAGKYKDMGNPDSPLTSAERAILLRDLNITMQNFINDVARNRGLSVASVTAIANGSPMLGQMALDDGLIDHIGTIYDVEGFLKGKIGTSVTLCQ